MTVPHATARLQFNSSFTLDDACEQVPYYARLGVSHLYASPLATARPGSTHGYDVIDHTQINPELGGEPALLRLVQRLREFGMGLILDIVPNHMATHPENAWWWSVLTHGAQSPHADWFDIDWRSPVPDLYGKILTPFLGQPYGEALDSGHILLIYDAGKRAFHIEAHGTPYPVAPGSLTDENVPVGPTEARTILAEHDVATEAGRAMLHALLERQHYRLAWWRTAPEEINWRRFFEVSELAGVCVEHPAVFDAVHALTFRLYEEGMIDGVRVDHVDGLADPIRYCRRLRAELERRSVQRPGNLAGDEPYLVIEKILAHDEVLDGRWSVHGTTGYDFMAQVQALLHDANGAEPLTRMWQEISGDERPPQRILRDAKRLMLQRHFPAERNATVRALHAVARSEPTTRDFTFTAIGRTLDALLLAFSVYRTYADDDGRDTNDQARMNTVLQRTHADLSSEHDGNDVPLLPFVDGWLGAQAPANNEGNAARLRRYAIRRFQQLTPPLAAKSLEDTSFYQYGHLLSANDVGSDPAVFAITPATFLDHCAWRAAYLPHAMLTTATHDHKRGEDVRARLAVISEIPDNWMQSVLRWDQILTESTSSSTRPSGRDRYMLYQTIVGAWPLTLALDDQEGLSALTQRIAQWQTKSVREAKLRASWFTPDEAYEGVCQALLERLMHDEETQNVLRQMAAFAQHMAPAGAVNSLTATVLRLTTPGVPDLYQGTENWDFSLVDPDNRRPVDYPARKRDLDALAPAESASQSASESAAAELLLNWRDGRIKQALISRILRHRGTRTNLYARGSITPLVVTGTRANHVVAFLRQYAEDTLIVIVPRLVAGAIDHGMPNSPIPNISHDFWGDTAVSLPPTLMRSPFWDIASECNRSAAVEGGLRIEDVLRDWPVAVLTPAPQ
jgi:(1->4)-alpha-D-glucan 1-alpha-D-glucosylmutase